jgi:predicted Zn-dependent protease
VGGFRDSRDNGKRPDPYAMISDAKRLNDAAAAVLLVPPQPARLEAAERTLDTLAGRDRENPAVAFWQGRARRTTARHAEALAAFQRALDLGRWDPDTLLLAGRSALDGGDADSTLALIASWRGRIAEDPRVLDLEAEAWGRKGEGAKSTAATRRAAILRADKRPPKSEGCR